MKKESAKDMFPTILPHFCTNYYSKSLIFPCVLLAPSPCKEKAVFSDYYSATMQGIESIKVIFNAKERSVHQFSPLVQSTSPVQGWHTGPKLHHSSAV